MSSPDSCEAQEHCTDVSSDTYQRYCFSCLLLSKTRDLDKWPAGLVALGEGAEGRETSVNGAVAQMNPGTSTCVAGVGRVLPQKGLL